MIEQMLFGPPGKAPVRQDNRLLRRLPVKATVCQDKYNQDEHQDKTNTKTNKYQDQ